LECEAEPLALYWPGVPSFRLDFGSVLSGPTELPNDRALLCVCTSGALSEVAAALLRSSGLEASSYPGGVLALRRARERRYCAELPRPLDAKAEFLRRSLRHPGIRVVSLEGSRLEVRGTLGQQEWEALWEALLEALLAGDDKDRLSAQD
jgi:hypothetical protein